MDNNAFINSLIDEGARKALPHPLKQTALWLSGTLLYLLGVLFYEGLRPDILGRLADSRYLLELAVLFAAAIIAASSALCLARPGNQIGILRGSLIALLGIWILVAFWNNPGLSWDFFSEASKAIAYDCVACIMFMAVPPGIAMFFMICKGVTINPLQAGSLATLAVTIFAYLCMRLIEPTDNPGHLILWHAIPVALMCGFGTMLGYFTLHWKVRL